MFWFSRKKFSGSYFRFSATKHLVLRGAVDLSAVRACFGYIVDVAPCGHEWFDLSDRGSSPRDPLLIVGRIRPCELRGDVEGRVPPGVGHRVVRNSSDSPALRP